MVAAINEIFFLFINHLLRFFPAKIYGKVSKRQIIEQDVIEVRFADNEIKKGIMIGKTKDIIFLLIGEKVEAIPISSLVKEIEIMKGFTNKKD